ncbi:hypothetical protein [Azospirillum sp.]|uniref:hypothetical protein n=1 Tax=Azospirillum sp. TaxID=34012 RepID=UPI00262A4FA5|nr:hypothetical protein [Azospirillum sp.]
MNKINGFDFTPYVNAVIAKGMSRNDALVSLEDLKVILSGPTDRDVALTIGADEILHEILADEAGLRRLSAMIGGPSYIIGHDGGCFMSARFDAAWEETRALMSAHGVMLLADYRSDKTGGIRAAGVCVRASVSVAA